MKTHPRVLRESRESDAWSAIEDLIVDNMPERGPKLCTSIEAYFEGAPKVCGKEIDGDWTGIAHGPLESYEILGFPDGEFAGKFLDQLIKCKCIFTMSIKEKQKWINYLQFLAKEKNQKYGGILVESLIHPIRAIPPFSWDAFVRNPKKMVIQSGRSLRRAHSIYKLYLLACLGRTQLPYRYHKVINPLSDTLGGVHGGVFSRKEYEELHRDNVFYLDLYDATASNTILDCISSATPIVVNRLPATEEYLGKDYPLLYDDVRYDAAPLIHFPENLEKGHIYLKSKDKTKFSQEYFIDSLFSSEIYCC